MNEVIIRIIDTANNVLGDLELGNFNDFPLAITKGIVNLDNLKERTGTYTKTFKVPNTKNNSNLLSSVDNINSRKDFRKALNKKPCIIIVNNNPIEKGFVQVSNVYNGFNLDSFELVFFGNNIDWVKASSEKSISTIDFRNNTQVYGRAEILATNQSTYVTSDHAYPAIDRSDDNTYKPVFYIRNVIDKGLKEIGWKYDSDFLDSSDISKLVADFDGEFKLSDADVEATRLQTEYIGSPISLGFAPSVRRIIYNNDTTLPNQDSNNNYSTSTGLYTVPINGSYNIYFTFSTTGSFSAKFDIVINGQGITDIGTGRILENGEEQFGGRVNQPNAVDGGSTDITFYGQAGGIPLNAGDTISIYGYGNNGNLFTEGYFQVVRKPVIELGDSYELNSTIPTDIKLIDVINDLTRMFNLYYWTDIKSKTIFFEPRNTFFTETDPLNWTDKLDLSQKYNIDYVSTYPRNITFKYKDLKNDNWLKGWQDVNKRTYGKYNYVLPDRFAEGTDTVSLSLFSASYAQRANDLNKPENGLPIKDVSPITLRIWSKYSEDKPNEQVKDYNPKIYFYQYGSQTSINGDTRKVDFLGTNTSTIPYGMFESYDNTTSVANLNFANHVNSDGSIEKGLFDTYYSNMFKNIEEGGRLIAYFNLNSVDIDNLDFRKLVYLDYPADVKGYYLIESVIDYKPLNNELTKVSLFKFENLGSVTIDGTQGGNNDAETDDGDNPTELDPIFIEATILLDDDEGSYEILLPVNSVNQFNGNIEQVFK